MAEYSVVPDLKLAMAYKNSLEEVKKSLSLCGDIDINSFVSQYGEVFKLKEDISYVDKVWEDVKTALMAVLEDFNGMRLKEGEFLKQSFEKNIDTMKNLVQEIEKKSQDLVNSSVQKIEQRIKELLKGVSVDENRLLTEAAFWADKTDVSEELTRLNSHMQAFKQAIEKEQIPVGRKLDFILQEINREVNTIGSKANDLNITHIVVDLKCEAEKIREQVQNIE